MSSARWRTGERSRSGGMRSVARRSLTFLNAPPVPRFSFTTSSVREITLTTSCNEKKVDAFCLLLLYFLINLIDLRIYNSDVSFNEIVFKCFFLFFFNEDLCLAFGFSAHFM